MVARANPLTYLVDALRSQMLSGSASAFGIGFDFAVQIVVLLGLVALAARLCPSVARRTAGPHDCPVADRLDAPYVERFASLDVGVDRD